MTCPVRTIGLCPLYGSVYRLNRFASTESFVSEQCQHESAGRMVECKSFQRVGQAIEEIREIMRVKG